jgi:hypothetical protein
MASTSEKTFGQRELKGYTMNETIQPEAAYAPPNNDISKVKYPLFMAGITTANNLVGETLVTLKEKRAARLNIYYGQAGLKKLVPRMRDFVASLPAGKKSSSFKMLQRICQKLSNYKKPKKVKETAVPDANVAKEHSTSEQSFGSLYRLGMDALEVIKQIAGYAPVPPELTVEGFTTFMGTVLTCDNEVAEAYNVWDNAVETRYELYEGENGLREKFQQIKNYIASQYSKDSNFYKDVLKIKY